MKLHITCMSALCVGTLGLACLAVQSSERAGASDRGKPRIPSNDDAFEPEEVLSYSGRGTVSLTMGDLVFVPESVKPQRIMGLPVVFPDRQHGELRSVPAEDEFRNVTGEVALRFDRWYSTLDVTVRGDEGESIDRTFDVFHAQLSSDASYEQYMAAYFEYMETGTFALDEGTESTGARPGGIASAPTLNNCNCDTGQCTHQQSCPDKEACRCDCKGNKCLGWCSNSGIE